MGMDKNARDSQSISNKTSMLAACAAEAGKGVPGYIVTTLNRYLADRIGHIVNGDF